VVKAILKVILGIIFLTSGILAVIKWKDALWTLLTGGIGLLLILIGALILAVAKD